jgi:transcriptional regulator with XRE-family HTH domain
VSDAQSSVLGHLGDRLARLRRIADLSQERLSERSGVSVEVIRKLEQHRKHSVRLPTLHKLASGLGVEVTALLGDSPALSAGQGESPALVAIRRAIMPSPLASTPEPENAEPLSLDLLRAEIAEGWTLYHAAEFGQLMRSLPEIIDDARIAVAVGPRDQREAAQVALGKALQLGGHLAIRLGKTDLALSSLERGLLAIERQSGGLAAAGQEELTELHVSARCGRVLPRMHLTELEETFSQRHHWRTPTVLCGAGGVPNLDPYDSETSDCSGCVDCLTVLPGVCGRCGSLVRSDRPACLRAWTCWLACGCWTTRSARPSRVGSRVSPGSRAGPGSGRGGAVWTLSWIRSAGFALG